MGKEEYFMRINMLGQEAEKIEQHMQAIEQQIQELSMVKQSIEAIREGKQSEILANLGKGVFVRTEIKSKELFVNIGKEVIIKKTPDETSKIIEEQIDKMIEAKTELMKKIENLQEQMKIIIHEAEKNQCEGSEQSANIREKNHKCKHPNCECDYDCENKK
jgi:prefoldin alpha subunit